MQIVSYRMAEQYCARLARKLESHLGLELMEAEFVAIPRGGLIVLGMLSYILALGREQVSGWGEGDANLTVVVDDCSFSGARFAATLQRLSAKRVIFAHLFSHPKLRQAILDSESRVEACFASEDLVEASDDQEAFSARWRDRLSGQRYWLGITEPIAFAWGEPDQVLWNARASQLEDNWHRASPRSSLDARVALRVPLEGGSSGAFDVPPDIVWKVNEDRVTLWHSQKDRVFELNGTAGAMWRALGAYGDVDRAARYLRSLYEVDEETLRSDLSVFAAELVARGLLVQPDESDRSIRRSA